jgi:hypothetical protein
VELAKAFGENAVIQSICQADFGPAMDAIIEVIAKQLGAVCLPKPLVRKADGKVGCNVVWELPKAGTAPPTTPTDCGGAFPYLLAADKDSSKLNDRGGRNCKVLQLPADSGKMTIQPDPETSLMQGWYYDDFSPMLAKECSPETPQRVAFTADAKPPTGVTVKLECLNETQRLVSNRDDVAVGADIPEIGTPCSGKKNSDGTAKPPDDVCAVPLSKGGEDRKMFCHPAFNVCVRGCSSNSDCPSAWVCDDRGDTLLATVQPPQRPDGAAFCVNPTCGSN